MARYGHKCGLGAQMQTHNGKVHAPLQRLTLGAWNVTNELFCFQSCLHAMVWYIWTGKASTLSGL